MSTLRFVALALLLLTAVAQGGTNADTIYTNRGKTDFDTFLHLLNPYGTWSKIGGKWAYTPTDHDAPGSNGRWLYTEYGWYWKGARPHSWATEHYGYWKRGADKVWSWYPGPYWLPQIVELRATDTHIGWRTAEVNENGDFVELPIDRYGKPEEWNFVALEKFANPITASVIAPADVARFQLEESTECRHTYFTYRLIDRPGPHPADFADLSKDGGMLAPQSMEEKAAAQRARTQAAKPVIPTPTPTNTPAATSPPTNAGGVPHAALIGTEVDPAADTRKVKYWVTMSLPTFWSPPPADAKVGELYIYRPDLFQDEDGIARRITLWFNPKARTALKDVFSKNPVGGVSGTIPNGPAAQPAVPVSGDDEPRRTPFSSPLDQPYRPGKATSTPATTPATNAPVKGAVPTGLK